MRTILILSLLFLSFGCSDKDNSKGSKNDGLQVVSPDTLQTESDLLHEKSQYIGFMDTFYFSKDNEAYIELYFARDVTEADEYNKIVALADSLIYEDDDNRRYIFPASLSPKYFDLRGLSKLKIYDQDNKFICNAQFLRVEYLDQNISSLFIAVYKTDKKIKANGYYGISNFDRTFEKANYTISKDTVLTQNILTKLNEQHPYYQHENNGTHLLFSDSDTILSVVNSENYAYIVLTSNEGFEVLYKSSDLENISDLKIIPITKNKLPYILTRNAVPDGDMMWEQLLHYDGAKYTIVNRQRID